MSETRQAAELAYIYTGLYGAGALFLCKNMERRFFEPSDIRAMFGGIQPSRGAEGLVKRAISLGEDPTALTQQAGAAARQDGKNKVGFFGKAEEPLNVLKDVIMSIEGRREMNKSARKASRSRF